MAERDIERVFSNNDLHVVTYLVALRQIYGTDYLEFEPETFQLEMDTSPVVTERIMSGILLETNGAFWNDITAFEKVSLAMNKRSVSFAEYQDISPAEIAWAVTEAGLITRPIPFSSDVNLYISKKYYDEGYIDMPAPLHLAQQTLDKMVGKRPVASGEMSKVQEAKHAAILQYIEKHHDELGDEFKGYLLSIDNR